MIGVDARTGRKLGGIAHLKQSIVDILTTPIGSRVYRREYGSRLFKLVDRPQDSNFAIEVFSAVAEALDKWEPRYKLTKISIASAGAEGNVILTLEGKYLPEGKEIKLEGVTAS
ncbi:GPW/gp25 family protein [Maridesulfovibrio sp.]|uniref:GPW/gp25 family protein n=1 Tax=Maridesulfovibrio sp. TaxID=2795000 RepID=UPI002A18B7CC|nr:GPW/gp25 family protein [Maridesulfovibrio sp.]